jgi:hypothetical protein
MADAAAPATGNPTPTPPVAPAASTPAAAPSASPPATTPTSQAAAPVSPEPAAAPAVTQEVSPTSIPAAPVAATEQPLFTLPDDAKLAPEARTKFEGFIKSKLVDGKVVMTSQEVADHFLEQSRDNVSRVEALVAKQIETINQTNEAACKSRFTAAQLSQAEAAVGFASSIDPAFREFAKRQLNDPVFVNFMREIGERLSEDEFEIGTQPTITQRKGPMTRKQAGQALYGKSLPKTN